MSTTKRETRSYDLETKVQAVKLARETSTKTASLELGIPQGTIRHWMASAVYGKIDTGVGTQTPKTALTQASRIQQLEAEIKALKKENARISELNEFLEEASAFFAASRQKSKKKSG